MLREINFKRFSEGELFSKLDDLRGYTFTLDDLVANNKKIDWLRITQQLPINSIEDLDKVISYISIFHFLLYSRFMFKLDREELMNYLSKIKLEKPYVFKKYVSSVNDTDFTDTLRKKGGARFYPKFLDHFADTPVCDWIVVSRQEMSLEDIEKYKKNIKWVWISTAIYKNLNSDFVYNNRLLLHSEGGYEVFTRIISKFEFTDKQFETMINENLLTWHFVFSKFEKDKDFFIQNFLKLVDEKNVKNPMSVLRYVNPHTLSKFIDKDILLLLKLY